MKQNAATAGTPGEVSPPMSSFRTLAPWFLVQFANSYAATLFSTGAYDYADKVLNVSASMRLWLSAAWGFAYIFISLQSGKLSERFGPRRVVGWMALLSVFTSLLGLVAIGAPNVWILLLCMLPFNVTSSTLWPALESGISRTKAKTSLNTRMALYNISWSAAGFVGLFTCGALEHWWWGNIFLIPALCTAASFVLFILWRVPANLVGKEHVPDDPHDDAADTPEMRRRAQTLLTMAWMGNALAYVAANVLLPVKMRLAGEAGIVDLATAAAITSVWGFLRVFGFIALWKWSGWHYRVRWLLGAQITLWLSFVLMMVINTQPMLVAMQVVFGLATAMLYASSLYYAMHVSDGHGGHAGIHEALIGLGICIGPAVGAIAGAGLGGHEALVHIAIGVSIVMFLGIIAMVVVAKRGMQAKLIQHD